MKILIAFLISVTIALPARAHTDTELTEWQADWETRWSRYIDTHHNPSPRLLTEYLDMYERHPCRAALGVTCESPALAPDHDTAPLATHTHTTTVEDWRGLVEAHFGPNTEAALRVMACESRGDAHAVNRRSQASGLFQFLPSTWTRTMNEAYPGGVFDGNRNIEAAAILSKGGTDWSQWSCRP